MIFNAMLFAVVALLMGATPVHKADLGSGRKPGCAAGSSRWRRSRC